MPLRRTPLLATIVVLLAAAAPGGARAASWATTSSNWAGYAVSKPGLRFGRVSGTWVAPTANCSSGGRRYSAVWLGLGGLHASSKALEQVGTEADCAGGKAYYSTWYELVPAGPVDVKLTVRPGDTISAAVTVSGHSVKLYIANRTRGTSFATQVRADQVDVGSAEWIAEAPSECGDNGGCQTLPLADFGVTSFANIRATSATGHSGAIWDPAWSAVAITLSPRRGPGGTHFASENTSGTATPANLSPAGDAFTVTYQPPAGSAPPPAPAAPPAP